MNRKTSPNEEPHVLDEPERYELYERPRYRFELDRRDFFKILGAGIVVCFAVTQADAYQQSGRRRRGGRRSGRSVTQELGAWLHINEAGEVTAFTGKVEIGQNARTSLTQAVAEELRLPIESIRLVMADTDLTPFDMGTSGSGTTPRMAPQLRRAAATARELLIDMAAKRLSVDRGSLAVTDGKVVHAAEQAGTDVRRAGQGQAFHQDGRFRHARHAGCKVEDRGHLGSQGRSPRDRDRQASIRFRRSAAGNAVWENPAAAKSQGVPEIGEPQGGPGRQRRHGRSRRRFHRRGGPHAAVGRTGPRCHSGGMDVAVATRFRPAFVRGSRKNQMATVSASGADRTTAAGRWRPAWRRQTTR